MVMDRGSFSYSEESDYNNEETSIKQIVLGHIKKISGICCQEFTGGYWEEKPVNTSGGVTFVKKWHEDTREAYCNAVDFLIDLVYPRGDEPFKKFINENEKDEAIPKDIKEKLKHKRKTFKEINILFDRINFFTSNDSINE